MNLVLQTPPKILFGRGTKDSAADEIARFGTRGILVQGANPARSDWATQALHQKGCQVLTLTCDAEPTLPMLEAALTIARPFGATWVAAVGGGAVLDMGKALSALLPSSSSPMDHLEVVGRGLPLLADPLPFIAVPTTAGTGAEVTKNAVIGLPDHRRKVSLRDDRMIARVAIVDPSLTDHCPWNVTLASGLDAVIQVVEPYLSSRANDYTDALARPAILRGLKALQRLRQGEDALARDELAWVSLCGGLCLAHAGLGAVHGLAGPIGGMCAAPHGAICAALLGPVLNQNRLHAAAAPNSPVARRIDEVCGMIAAVIGGSAQDAPHSFATWRRQSGLAGLTGLGLALSDHIHAAQAALEASSMKSNPFRLSQDDLLDILSLAAA